VNKCVGGLALLLWYTCLSSHLHPPSVVWSCLQLMQHYFILVCVIWSRPLFDLCFINTSLGCIRQGPARVCACCCNVSFVLIPLRVIISPARSYSFSLLCLVLQGIFCFNPSMCYYLTSNVMCFSLLFFSSVIRI
jgi:hypothetical protein